jgi:sugar O-acyltransferase (sialic acid O-acetyltransferase NeuD family)
MKGKLVIFGTGCIAQLAHYYFTKDSNYEVVAFTVDAGYKTEDTFCGLPVIAFNKLVSSYSADDVSVFVALSYSQLNAIRKEKYLTVKNLGYRIASYISSKAIVLNDGAVGENCFILEGCILQPFSCIGNNVTIWSGSHIGHHSVIKDHVFVAPSVSISGSVMIGEQCFLGINSTLRNNIVIGERCVVGAGALLSGNAAPDGVYKGLSAKRLNKKSSELKGI